MAAADALTAQGEGRTPDRADVYVGALALRTLCKAGSAGPDLHDAAIELEALANGIVRCLDELARARLPRLPGSCARLPRDAPAR